MLSQLAPPGRAGGHHELEVADGRSRQPIRFGAIERAACRARTATDRRRAGRGPRCRSAPGHGAIHIRCSLRGEGLAFGDRAALERLASQEQPSVAPPYQRLGMVRIGGQRIGDQLHGAVEGGRVAIHAGEHVLAHLEVEALLGEDGQTGRKLVTAPAREGRSGAWCNLRRSGGRGAAGWRASRCRCRRPCRRPRPKGRSRTARRAGAGRTPNSTPIA